MIEVRHKKIQKNIQNKAIPNWNRFFITLTSQGLLQ